MQQHKNKFPGDINQTHNACAHSDLRRVEASPGGSPFPSPILTCLLQLYKHRLPVHRAAVLKTAVYPLEVKGAVLSGGAAGRARASVITAEAAAAALEEVAVLRGVLLSLGLPPPALRGFLREQFRDGAEAGVPGGLLQLGGLCDLPLFREDVRLATVPGVSP